MDEELKSRLAGYLDAIESQAEKAGHFVVEQTPLVAQEYLAWVFWSNCFVMAVCIVICIASVVLSVIAARVLSKSDFDDLSHPLSFFGGIACLVGVVISTVIGLCSAADAIKVSVAPRVVLLEKVADLAD